MEQPAEDRHPEVFVPAPGQHLHCTKNRDPKFRGQMLGSALTETGERSIYCAGCLLGEKAVWLPLNERVEGAATVASDDGLDEGRPSVETEMMEQQGGGGGSSNQDLPTWTSEWALGSPPHLPSQARGG